MLLTDLARLAPIRHSHYCFGTNAAQNICGVSVVDSRFEELKRYNLAEIFDPTPKEAAPPVQTLQTAESTDSTSMPDAAPQECAADSEQKATTVETTTEAVMDTS